MEIERLVKTLVVIAVIVVAVFFGYILFENWQNKRINSAVEKERKLWQIKTEALQEEIERLKNRITLQSEAKVPYEKFFDVFGEGTKLTYPIPKEIDCKELERRIRAFFEYLDKKDYIVPYRFGENSLKQFQLMFVQVSKAHPIITGETRDVLTLMRNTAHFYRVLGPKRVKLIIEILKNESDIMEQLIATFSAYFSKDNRCRDNIFGNPSFDIFYTYSGFFLNTLAGRSYLFRRDSIIRALMSYYCVLFVDMANDKKVNHYGIDIRPYINFSMFDIINRTDLMYQEQYLAKLVSLKKKYNM